MKLITFRMIRKGSRMGRSNTLQTMSKKLLKIELEFEVFLAANHSKFYQNIFKKVEIVFTKLFDQKAYFFDNLT